MKATLIRRMFLISPTLLSHLSSVTIIAIFGISGKMDLWTKAYTLPGILSGIVNMIVMEHFAKREFSWKRFPIEIVPSIAFYFALVFGVSSVVARDWGLTLVHMRVAFGFALSIAAVPYVMRLWARGMFREPVIANGMLFAGQILVTLAFGLQWESSRIAAVGTTVGGLVYLCLAIFFDRRYSMDSPVSNDATAKRTFSQAALSLVNPSTLTAEKLILDQFAIGLSGIGGALSLYFVFSRILNAGSNLLSAIVIPERVRSAHLKAGTGALARRFAEYLPIAALGVAVAGSLALAVFLGAYARHEGVSVKILLGAAMYNYLGTLFLSWFFLGNIFFASESNANPLRILKVLWLVDFSGRLFFYYGNRIERFFFWSFVITTIELYLLGGARFASRRSKSVGRSEAKSAVTALESSDVQANAVSHDSGTFVQIASARG